MDNELVLTLIGSEFFKIIGKVGPAKIIGELGDDTWLVFILDQVSAYFYR